MDILALPSARQNEDVSDIKQHLYSRFLSPSSLLSVSPSCLLGIRKKLLSFPHTVFDKGEKERRWLPGYVTWDEVLSWKQPFPWDCLDWQEVTVSAGDIGQIGHKRLWEGLSHLNASSRVQLSPLNLHPCSLHINSSLSGTHLSLRLSTRLKEKHWHVTCLQNFT